MKKTAISAPTLPTAIGSLLDDARVSFRRSVAECEKVAREHPQRALWGAVAVGAIVRSLPMPSFFGAGLRLAWLAAPSALAVVGAGALAEYCREKDAALSGKPRRGKGVLTRLFRRKH